jgi:periplasmic protein TonB
MAMQRMSFIGLAQDAPTKPGAARLPLPANVRKDVFLSALLEMPTTKRPLRNPFQWASAALLHVAIISALIIVPLYLTGTINLSKVDEVPLVAPPPPPAAPAAAPAASPRITHPRARFSYTAKKLTTPNSIPKRVTQESADAAAPPDLSGAVGGVPGGVVGGEIGGLAGGAFGGTGTAVPPPPPQPQPTKRLVRAGSLLRPPRQTLSIDPEYPALALQTHISGSVVVDAVIDERGNVVQVRAVSGHPLLIAAALRAVSQWKYEPTSLNGQPVSVELQVQVHFHLPTS